MPVYSVVVCPKCRKSAQLIEQKGAKTTRCQRCGATLQTRKLRIFHTTNKLEEAIAVRTKLQAEVLGKGYGTTPESAPSGFTSFSPLKSSQKTMSGPEEKEIILNYQTHQHKIATGKRKKDPAKIILSILGKEQSPMSVAKLRDIIHRQDIDEETFDNTVEKLLQKGDIYSPKKGYIRIVA